MKRPRRSPPGGETRGRARHGDQKQLGGSFQSAHHQAADIVAQLLRAKSQRRGGASIKSLVYANEIQNKKKVYALCCETLKHLTIIKEVLREAKFVLPEGKFRTKGDGGEEDKPASFADSGAGTTRKAGLVYVWVYELLFGQWDKIQKSRKFNPVVKQETELVEAYDLVKTRPSSSNSDGGKLLSPLESKTFPKYLRVNTLKISVDEAFQSLSAEYGADNVKRNKYLGDVLELPASVTDLYSQRLVRNGSVVQQGLSSCMPVHALEPLQKSWCLIDACSAPGNKTTQLAAHLAMASGGSNATGGRDQAAVGKIFAFDLDPNRFERLKKNVRHCGAGSIVLPELRDFLAVDHRKEKKFAAVKAILLDPSCSGSGTIHSRGDYLLGLKASDSSPQQSESDKRRVDTLASFQEKCLRHALNFPNVERVVYSTCSIHVRENETVVASVLAEAERLGFQLEKALPQWPRRGYPLFETCDKLVRVNPNKDKSDGFFLALFVRKQKTAGPR
ncbi:rRNA methyltransferase [Chloropicon primus]|uniref:rRNA methyltransferase n=1 Tax=Chloropicon primus TaxID=1764295 RepID=A0A5B8MXY9_9CHLO|nr:rRNA methyltransferase [Chloropicon primus]|mmetsp:Transcript_5847/g.17628  ORF Transcript_5847/g.17628 Transcript_5847/m.17628 type:complete len:504 (-) Transcript_5847:114-1625(-)|eukprot:QDZ24370.1 rRNA methyltransferase [Chloropicon primus]